MLKLRSIILVWLVLFGCPNAVHANPLRRAAQRALQEASIRAATARVLALRGAPLQYNVLWASKVSFCADMLPDISYPPQTVAIGKGLLYNKEIQPTLVGMIDHALSSVFMYMFEFDDPEVLYALSNAACRGLDVSIVVDRRVVSGKQAFLAHLINSGVTVYCAPRVEHRKSCFVDYQILLLETSNVTVASRTRNDEEAVLLKVTRDHALERCQVFAYAINGRRGPGRAPLQLEDLKGFALKE